MLLSADSSKGVRAESHERPGAALGDGVREVTGMLMILCSGTRLDLTVKFDVVNYLARWEPGTCDGKLYQWTGWAASNCPMVD